jgi:hypothetical protein
MRRFVIWLMLLPYMSAMTNGKAAPAQAKTAKKSPLQNRKSSPGP